MGRMSKRVVLSYIFDWIVIIAAVVVGGILSRITPNKRHFSPVDPSISFPFVNKEKVSSSVLVIVAVASPAVIIFLICLFFIPGPPARTGSSKWRIWQRKAWELNTGLLGLGLSCAAAFLLTNGSKNLFGKPRPDLLSRCSPDLANISMYAVGGFGDKVQEGIVLVSAAACKGSDTGRLNDGFRSFPSGHSSLSWAGMTYLTLFLAAKFAITIPYLAPRAFGERTLGASAGGRSRDLGSNIPLRSQAAAPPLYLLIVALIPIIAAIYISSTRYSDYRHHGFDILFGALLGFVCAWFAFRWYHLPITRGAGYAWGARGRSRAFGIGIGVGSYADREQLELERSRKNPDLERGTVATAAEPEVT
ncbi:MAG: hypothetical protein M1839_004718 [Geoglossum umbratile]|nr:MAG: hypothetical protein M1839_004718 [Geoglossum umbratile]